MNDNELIEKFWIEQGGKPHPSPDLWFYESDWNMLIPVVHKISEMYFDEGDEHGFNPYYDVDFAHDLLDMPIYSKIDDIYLNVIRSIKWYNQTKKP